MRRIYISRPFRSGRKIGFTIMVRGSMAMEAILRGSCWGITMAMGRAGKVGWWARMGRVRSWRKVIQNMVWNLWRHQRVVTGRRWMRIYRNPRIKICIEASTNPKKNLKIKWTKITTTTHNLISNNRHIICLPKCFPPKKTAHNFNNWSHR